MTMKHLSIRNSVLVGTAAGVVAIGAIVAACGGSSSNGGNGNGSSSGGGQGSCPNPTVELAFSPMYSAFVTDSTQQTFQIPVIVADGTQATWTSSDPSSVQLTADPVSGGEMITIAGTGTNGTVTIYATEASGACGA